MSDHSSPRDDALVAAWRIQLEQATKNPFLLQLLLRQWQKILKRLTYFYAQLALMPRRNRRALQRTLATSLVGAAMLLALSGAPAVLANNITVSGACTLDEAIGNANDTTTGQPNPDCAAGNPAGADTITLTGNVVLGAELPHITSPILLEGGNFSVSGAGLFRVFYVESSGDFTIHQTTVTDGLADVGADIFNDGKLTANESYVVDGHATYYAGGIANISGNTYINYSTLAGNYSDAYDGAIHNGGTMTVDHSTVTTNYAVIYAGGIHNQAGTLTVTNSTIEDNSVGIGPGPIAGGGAFVNNPGATLTIESSVVTGNNGNYYGGGIVNGGDVTITSSTFYHNGAFAGGGIFNAGGTVEINTSSLTGNAAFGGGAIDNYFGQVTLNQSTVGEGYALAFGGGILTGHTVVGCMRPGTLCAKPRNNAPATAQSAAFQAKMAKKYPELANLSGHEKAATGFTWEGRHKKRGKQVPAPKFAPVATETTLNNSTVSGNVTGNAGGGIANLTGNLTLNNVTVTNNTAYYYFGGGIANDCTMTTVLNRTLVSGNIAYSPAPLGGINEIWNCPTGTVTANHYNLFGHSGETNAVALYNVAPGATDFNATSDGDGTSNHVPTTLPNILVTTLGNNGGPTLTNKLAANSPAIDKAPNTECATKPINGIDQRGAARNVDVDPPPTANDCDIGAYEAQVTTAVNVTGLKARMAKEGGVTVAWHTTTESQIAGFDVYRQGAKGKWRKMNKTLIEAKHAGDAAGDKYRFVNRKVKPGKTYYYELKVSYLDGHTEWTGTVKVKIP